MKKIILPKDELGAMRDQIWSQLTHPDPAQSKEAYVMLLQTISHPAAIARGRCIQGTRLLQSLVSILIFWRWFSWLLGIGFVFLGLRYSWLWFLGLPLLLLFDLLVVNRQQTTINIELAARLFLLDEKMDKDDSFRSQVLEYMEMTWPEE